MKTQEFQFITPERFQGAARNVYEQNRDTISRMMVTYTAGMLHVILTPRRDCDYWDSTGRTVAEHNARVSEHELAAAYLKHAVYSGFRQNLPDAPEPLLLLTDFTDDTFYDATANFAPPGVMLYDTNTEQAPAAA